MKDFVTILLTLFIFIGVMGIIYIYFYNNIQALRVRINEAECIIDELLRKKYDLLINAKNMIFDKTSINKKTFETLDTIKKLNISSFDFERKLTEINNLVNQIIDDHEDLTEDEDFNGLIEDIYELNEKLEASKSFFNKYTSLLNKSLSRFPSNIIGRLHHIEVNSFFDGKDFKDNIITDFKL